MLAPLMSDIASRVTVGLPGPGLARAAWERYRELLASGVGSDRILVWLSSESRSAWVSLLKGELPEHIAPQSRPEEPPGGLDRPTGAQRVQTPRAWVQAELQAWWPLVDEALDRLGFVPARRPGEPRHVAIGMAQALLARFTSDLRPPGGTLLEWARSPRNLQDVQLLDALARWIEHGGTALAPGALEGLERCLAAGLPELVAPGELRVLLEHFVRGMLEHRVLDHALALDAFLHILAPEPLFRQAFRASTDHWIVENVDDLPACLLDWLESGWASGITVHAFTSGDPDDSAPDPAFRGGLREHLGGDLARAARLVSGWPVQGVTLDGAFPYLELARCLHAGLAGDAVPRVRQVPPLTSRMDHLSHAQMIDAVVPDVADLARKGEASRIALVVPALDSLIIWSIRHRFERAGIGLHVFAGTNRLTDHRPVRLMLAAARLAHPAWGRPCGEFERLELLEVLTGLDPIRLSRVAAGLVGPDGGLPSRDQVLAVMPRVDLEALSRLDRVGAWLARRRETPLHSIEGFFREAFVELEATRLASGAIDEPAQRGISQIGQLLELARDFERIERHLGETRPHLIGERFMAHLDGNPIAERPFFRRAPHREAVMLATASQLAERGFRAPGDRLEHLFLLDLGSERWWKHDRRELVHPRVCTPAWSGGPRTLEADEADARVKLARVLFASLSRVRTHLHLHACLTDAEGRENLGELPSLFERALVRGS
ncbi:MAG: hypothetical protein VKP72_11325 [bacterium]|nr:hypothetical protein [bacterium]